MVSMVADRQARTALLAGVVLALALGGAATSAWAQKRTARYQVRFKSVANNCKGTGVALSRGKVELTSGPKRQLLVSIPMIPLMRGRTVKGGKFNARAKRGKTGISGLDGKFSIAGTVKGHEISFVFIAEYYRGKAPLCTQSWKGTGKRTE